MINEEILNDEVIETAGNAAEAMAQVDWKLIGRDLGLMTLGLALGAMIGKCVLEPAINKIANANRVPLPKLEKKPLIEVAPEDIEVLKKADECLKNEN